MSSGKKLMLIAVPRKQSSMNAVLVWGLQLLFCVWDQIKQVATGDLYRNHYIPLPLPATNSGANGSGPTTQLDT
jgi:hypothetical protein